MTRDDLERRRAGREAEHLLNQLRVLIESYDAGSIDLEVLGCTADRVGGRLADLVLAEPLT